MKVKRVHIGMEIEQRTNQLRLTNTEFGKRIGVAQQNIGRIFKSPNINTEKLAHISEALDFNFFSLYSDSTEIRQAGRDYVEKGKIEHQGTEYNGSVQLPGDLASENAELRRKLIEAQEKIIKLMEDSK